MTTDGQNILEGIVKGRDDNTIETYYCKVNYIMKEIDVTPTVAKDKVLTLKQSKYCA